MKAQVSIDDRQLFACIDTEETNESADKCGEPETHDEFTWNDVNNCELDPAQVRMGRLIETVFSRKMPVFMKVPVHTRKETCQ